MCTARHLLLENTTTDTLHDPHSSIYISTMMIIMMMIMMPPIITEDSPCRQCRGLRGGTGGESPVLLQALHRRELGRKEERAGRSREASCVPSLLPGGRSLAEASRRGRESRSVGGFPAWRDAWVDAALGTGAARRLRSRNSLLKMRTTMRMKIV